MSSTSKMLFRGSGSSAGAPRYTCPTTLYAIVKSIIIVNTSTINQFFQLDIAGTRLMDYRLSPGETLVLGEFDHCLFGGDQIVLTSNTQVYYYISGIEFTLDDYLYRYVQRLGRGTLGPSLNLVNQFAQPMVGKSLTIHNPTTATINFNLFVRVGSTDYPVIWAKPIKSYETITIPILNLAIDALDYVYVQGEGLNYYMTGRAVMT